jgi:membrane-associated phospholipid phosphatase
MMPVTARLAATFGILVALACALYPAIDIGVASLFYDPARGDRFILHNVDWIDAVRQVLLYLPLAVTLVAVLSLLGNWLRLPLARHLPPRSALFLVSTLLLIPGLLVNGLLKENWGRPRPGEVVEFRGPDPFYPWWKPGGPCDKNCSFVSGEVSATAWLTAAASLTPPTVRPWVMGAAVAATAVSALLRMGFGRHWFSDVVIAATLTIVLVALARHLFFGRRGRGDPADPAPESTTP